MMYCGNSAFGTKSQHGNLYDQLATIVSRNPQSLFEYLIHIQNLSLFYKLAIFQFRSLFLADCLKNNEKRQHN